MTARPSHGLGAMRRLIQMSRNRVFIYVEGRGLDPDFYSRLCGPICAEHALPYEVITGDRIGGGGKRVLTSLFEYLRERGSLIDRSGPRPKLAMFYLDKDTDDIFRTKRRSAHAVYSTYYCVENHLFCEGDLISSIATAGSIDSALVRGRILDPTVWRRAAAVRWRDWITLCLSAQRLRISGPASYSVNHGTVDSNVNPANLATCEADLHARSGLPQGPFDQIIAWARGSVNRLIRRGAHDSVFKGKWYVVFVLEELAQIALAHGPINQNGARDRLIGSLMATLRFDGQWAEHYKEPLRRAIAAL